MSYELNAKTGKLTIANSEQFLKILTSDSQEATENYLILKKYGMKQIHSMAGDIPFNEYEYIIDFAIAKAIKDFEPKYGASILSFFWEKLRGEISSYRTKRDRLQDKVIKLMQNEEGVEYIYQTDKDTEENYIIPIAEKTMEEDLIETDLYERQIKALKMAFSGIPRDLQIILHEIGNGKKIHEISDLLNLPSIEISRKRNQGLSLILQRIMRGNHLTEEEKKELSELHDIQVEDFE